ncbi:MAG TPA: XdhC family protein [Acidobacteriaceae bacterium]|jgi:xanthine/CO dehydrogenase XdhC/CoxF family maturation factor|nr:XdhC family protein [Acidobacteriaceae bacterium]
MMRERRDIVALWHDSDSAVLATLVGVQGSSYRRPGARLLIASDGRYAGAISGGCLEAELIRKARWSVRDGAVVQRFSTAFDDTTDIPYGLGCGGTVDVLLEPSGTPEFNAILHALEASIEGNAQIVRTWLPDADQPLRRSIRPVADVEEGESLPSFQDQDGVIEELLLPPQRLVVCGAGDDARPIAALAAMMGWDVVVADGRAQWARPDRFPEAKLVQLVTHPARFPLRAGDAVIAMTHSYEQDREWLAAALPLGVRYLGLLGSRHRSALLISEAAAALNWPVARVCEQVFAPVGLDLGGDGAESIALAIVAEIQARCEGKLGASQRMTAALVAEQIAKGGASRYLQTQCAL